jgi:hypothetical protein
VVAVDSLDPIVVSINTIKVWGVLEMLLYYQRYKSGEYAKVWRELLNLVVTDLNAAVFSDVLGVARELVDRAYSNLSLLYLRLHELGYKFASPDEALAEATDESRKGIETIENILGALPLVVKVWYERMASVNFSQAESQLEGYEHEMRETPDIIGLGRNPVFVFLSLDKVILLREQLLEEYEELNILDDKGSEQNDVQQFAPLGGWASNCEPKGFWLPNSRIDDVFYNDGSGDVFFADEIRVAFKCGGFPFWKNLQSKHFSLGIAKPNLPKLLPILTKDILPL